MRTRVVPITICLKLPVFSSSEGTYSTLDLDVPEMQGLLPQSDSIDVHWMLNNVAVDIIEWNIVGYAGFDRDHEVTGLAFFNTDQAAIGSQKLAATNFPSSTHYQQHVRLQLRWKLKDVATPVPSTGELSIVLYVTTKGT